MNNEQRNVGMESLKEDFEKETNFLNDKKMKGHIDSSAKFDVLAETCQTSFSEMQIAMQELLKFKDELLMHYLPPPLLFRLTVIFSKIYRSFSDINTPINEILRLVKIYSSSWEKNGVVLKRIHDMYENKKQLLNLAIKRLAIVEKNTKLIAREKRVLNWEKLFIKLSESKGHGRRWRFQIENFRKQANLGKEELKKWLKKDYTENFEHNILRNSMEYSKSNEVESNEHQKTINEGKFESDLILELKDSNMSEELKKKHSEENYINEIDSIQDFFSQESSEFGKKDREKEKKPVFDSCVQTEAEMSDKSIWTGEPEFTRFFIIRLYKPAEHYNKKIKFQIKLGNQTQHSNTFDIIKKVVIVDNKSSTKNIKSKNSKIEIEKNKEESDRKVDLNKYEDFVFQVNDYSLKKEALGTTLDDKIEIQLTGLDDSELTGYSFLQLDDVHTLDLPILYHKDNIEFEIDDRHKPTNDFKNFTSLELLNQNQLTDESINNYGIFSKRSPFTFDMYRNKNLKSSEIICKLPLMFFWVRKKNMLNLDKKTNTQSLNELIEDLTGFNIEKLNKNEIQELLESKQKKETASSPIQVESVDQLPKSAKSVIDESQEFNLIQNQKISEIHEEYQMKIDGLKIVINQLENELIKLKSLNEIKDNNLNDFKMKKTDFQNIEQNKKKLNSTNEKTKARNANNNLLPSQKDLSDKKILWNKEMQDGFYQRLKQFNHKSYLHQKELIEKYVSHEASVIEQQMAVQHRLDTSNANEKVLDDFCLPAVFMPFKSDNNVFNPRARQYFHSSGTNIRLTQPPSIFQLPPLPSKPTLSVINLFDLGRRYEAGEPDFFINEFINSTAGKLLNKSHNEKSNEN